MGNWKHNSSRYCGYRTPFHDEICSERWLHDMLKAKNDSVFLPRLMPLRRQLPVFGVEKLDLLALDQNAVAWVFEFKRDVAPYGAIAQLQTYGTYVAGFDLTELQHVYGEGDHRRRNLKRDFAKFFEGRELPPTATHQVNLVLAAYDFSLPCRRTLDFLEHSANLVIGQLKIDCVWNQTSSPVTEYRWLKYPQRTEPIDYSPLRCAPKVYYALSMHGDNSPLSWQECMHNEILPVPPGWDLNSQPLNPNEGVFVYINPICSHEEAERWNCATHGVVAYGVIEEPPFDLWSRPNQFRLAPSTANKLHERDGSFPVMRVRWVQARFAGQHAEPPALHHFTEDEELALVEVTNRQAEWKTGLGMDPDECPF